MTKCCVFGSGFDILGFPKDPGTRNIVQGRSFNDDSDHPASHLRPWYNHMGDWLHDKESMVSVLRVDPSSRFYVGKIIDRFEDKPSERNILEATQWAIDYGVDIIYFSMRTPSMSPTLQEAVKLVVDNDILLVCNMSTPLQEFGTQYFLHGDRSTEELIF
ncbi:hypothetical protein QBC34DRAFT_386911 [Podospora aff. communis PSN243]|uniref:Uncharacterized protein n=1 Tax=Podospora aff. communis PSN243 TaxID=3040156 RepID=A0AAV9G5Z9_9PEZI|nr:hypothetical protein QBC34DRAFT_386911 [Podospora aff. communis PSN243]